MTEDKKPIFCPCCVPPRKIGEHMGGGVFIRHNGREIKAPYPVEIKCERCGTVMVVFGPKEAKNHQ
ncbi:MAG: hypothetical protein RR235_07330 [Oscillospiraceae bacterium]